jgi:hypothetical protein
MLSRLLIVISELASTLPAELRAPSHSEPAPVTVTTPVPLLAKKPAPIEPPSLANRPPFCTVSVLPGFPSAPMKIWGL